MMNFSRAFESGIRVSESPPQSSLLETQHFGGSTLGNSPRALPAPAPTPPPLWGPTPAGTPPGRQLSAWTAESTRRSYPLGLG